MAPAGRARGLVGWKVKDADALLTAALKISADHHSIAATALKLMLETPGPKARELAVLYSRYGQPAALRSAAHREVCGPGQGRRGPARDPGHAGRRSRSVRPLSDVGRGARAAS